MNEVTRIQEIIKSSLKASGLQYSDLAKKLKVSLPSIKRMLNGEDLPLSKVIEVSRCLGIDVFELLEQARYFEPSVHVFTLEQEAALAADFTVFLTFRLILMSTPLPEIMEQLSLKRSELNKHLRTLEKCQLIELWPHDKIKLLAHFPFKWIENGPLEKTYQKRLVHKIQKEIAAHGLNRRSGVQLNSLCVVKELLLTPQEGKQFEGEIENVIKKYSTLTGMRMRHKVSGAEAYSFVHLGGRFSWWEE